MVEAGYIGVFSYCLCVWLLVSKDVFGKAWEWG